MVYRNDKDHGLKAGMLDNAFVAYLNNSTLLPIGERGNLDLVTVTSAKTNDAILFYTFFLRLILNNIFISFNEKENAKALAELEEEYKNSEKMELLFVRGLYFALFECCKNQIKIDELIEKSKIYNKKSFLPVLGKTSSFISSLGFGISSFSFGGSGLGKK